MIKEFKEFIMRGDVLDLAVGVVIGAAFGKIVSSLVTNVIMPPIGYLLGGIDFSNLFIPLSSIPVSTVAEAKDLIAAGQFEEGTMLPKIEAAIAYLEKVPAGKVLITSMDHVKDAIRGKAGTVITA